MLLSVVVTKGVSRLEVLSTNNAGVSHVQMNLCVALCFCFLGRRFSTNEAKVLSTPVISLSDHGLNRRIQI